MIPLKTLIQVDKTCHVPVYLQIAQSIIGEIQKGILKAGTKLPGSRVAAELLQVHRKTVVKAFEELESQGWIEIIPYKGTFITQCLPQVKARPLIFKNHQKKLAQKNHLQVQIHPVLSPAVVDSHLLGFDDGSPDVRLAPINELAKVYASTLRNIPPKKMLGYGETSGMFPLRETLAKELNKTRGLNITAANVMITKGSQMGIYIAAATLLQKGDTIIIGETNYFTANITFKYIGAQLERIPVDEDGLMVDKIEQLCKKKKVRAIFVTSHHHHPTTVTLSPQRRIHLLALAEKYHFAIIEDDYDYDYHYANSPALPLASADQNGLVTYIGSFTKNIAPAFRIGYLIAPEYMIKAYGQLRRILDRQGDPVLELALAELIQDGVIRRYLKKSLKQYRSRRDLCAQLLQEKLSEHIQFKIPDGGMAIWAKFNKRIDLPQLSQLALQNNCYLSSGLNYNPPKQKLNACRMGFASRNLEEIETSVNLLEQSIQQFLSKKR